ncbi:putative membrane protein [Clostridium tetanomorphum]|uniref:QueT transporter family protein n=1 Tax=Clostridium tetanomorphum TaxID=1553 RepID=A0A923J2A9_CLOTT|nr:QueT transporter family protein [Clostridium tetanomorphum]KAJ49196.1 transporter [Clostridium tetanomorphum DSM 665]KAJ50497.1 transporter [Clostridium tetanomorphum DSM 665]MBC2398288.1 QueT transporter family protein [Clostridium tetanomorphum]MBP1865595.1 putative membrane protein [Clostridium tetanomorphum]NRS85899.1 putative membrane protein [Clostridium tetanomorphum]
MKKRTKNLTLAAVIASMYAVITIFLTYSMSYQASQFRVAEALTILPFFTPTGIYGLFVGCIIANILSPVGPLDVIFGSLATLIGALMTYYIGKSNLRFKKYIAPLPPVIINAIVIGFLLYYTAKWPLFITMLQVGLGELLSCYGLGLPLLLVIEKNKELQEIF